MLKAKEYLNEALQQDRKVSRMLEQLERLEAMANRVTAVVSDMPKAPGRDNASREVLLVKLVDLKYEINTEIDILADMKEDRRKLIDKLSKSEYQDVLIFRYLLAMKWEDVAERMEISERYAYMLHGNALLELEKIMPEQQLVQ